MKCRHRKYSKCFQQLSEGTKKIKSHERPRGRSPETQSPRSECPECCARPFIDERLLFEGMLWVNGPAGGRSFKPSLLKQSSLSPLPAPHRLPFEPLSAGVLTPIDWDSRKNSMVNLSNTDQGEGKGRGAGGVFVCVCLRETPLSPARIQ